MQKLILFLSVFFLSAGLRAQRYSFKNYTTHDGLVQTEITDITQDKRGAIWIGTRGGISVFDGKNFTNFDSQDLLQNLFINALYCDTAGTMWIATDNGLLKYDREFHVFFKSNNGPKNSVTSLTADAHHRLLFVCNNNIYQTDGKTVKPFPVDRSLEGQIEFIAFDRSDNLWITTMDFRVYRKTANGVKAISTPFKEAQIKQGLGMMKILGQHSRTPYFVTNFGTMCVRNDSLVFFSSVHPSFVRANVGAAVYVLPVEDSTFWVGGTMGMTKLQGNEVKRFAEFNGFCDNSVSCIFKDNEQNIWIGCTFNGVYKLSNEALFQPDTKEASYDLHHISHVVSLPNSEVLIGTWGRGLFSMYGSDSLTKRTAPSYMMRYITGLLPMGNKTLIGWFGKGLWQMDNATHVISELPCFAADEAVSKMHRVGTRLLFETLNHHCYLTDSQLHVMVRTELPPDQSTTVVNERIYVVNSTGYIALLDTNLQTVQKNLFPQISSRITEIVTYRNYTLVGTFGQGLFLYDHRGKLLKRMDKTNGLFTNIVTSLLVDGDRLFIGSNLGLISTDLPNLQHVKLFKESEGMFNWECRTNGLTKLPDGAILVATTNGPYLYYPDKDKPVLYGQVTVAGFAYGDNCAYFSPVGYTHSLTNPVSYHDNNVVITLKGISQRNPDDIVYHYQLQGGDTAWISTTSPVMAFNSLAPGAYRFKAYITAGEFRSKPLSVMFSVAKPLSGRLWFQVLLVLAFSLVCWALLTVGNRIYQRYIQSKMLSRLEKEVADKQQLTTDSVMQTKQQFEALRSFLEPSPLREKEEKIIGLLLQDIAHRLQILWQRDEISVSEIHSYFDELITEYGKGAKVYHKEMSGNTRVSVLPAFHLLQLFSLYLVVSLFQNCAAVFSLDSEAKTNGRLLLRFYTLKSPKSTAKHSIHQFLKKAIETQKPVGMAVDVIENLEYGNMLVAELTVQNENT